MNKDYLYIFVHIPKTGGSTFRKHIEKNIPEEERWLMDYPQLRLGVKNFRRDKLLTEIKREMDESGEDRKEKIRVVYGHMVPYGIHKILNKKPRYVIFVRNPERRLMSLYNYFATRYHRDLVKGIEDKAYEYQLLVSGKFPKFSNWVKNKYGQSGLAVETTLQHLKNLGYLKNVNNRNEYTKALDNFYYIAITKYLDDDLNYLYYLMGFKKYFINQNVSKKFVKDFPVLGGANPYIRRNRIFFRMAEERRTKIIKKLNAIDKAKKVEIKKNILLPVTQIIFDLRGILTETSARMRIRSPIYSKIFDFIRGYGKSRM